MNKKNQIAMDCYILNKTIVEKWNKCYKNNIMYIIRQKLLAEKDNRMLKLIGEKSKFIILLFIVLFITYFHSYAQPCINIDRYFISAGSGLFSGKEFQFRSGIGKYINDSYSSISVEYYYIKEYYSLLPIIYSKSNTLKFSYTYSFRFCNPLYLNMGTAYLVGQEKTAAKKKFISAMRFFSQIEGRCFNSLSFFFEPGINYRFSTLLKEKTCINLEAGIKIYFQNQH